MAQVTIAVVALSVPVLALTLVQLAVLGRWWRDPLGRVIIGALFGATLWLLVFLAYAAGGALVGGVPPHIRQPLNLALALGILAQAVATTLGLWRYRRDWRT